MISDRLAEMAVKPLRAVGFQVEVDEVPFEVVLAQHYRTVERTYHVYFLGSNFMHTFDPYFDFHTADEYQGQSNTSGLRDEKLMRLALNMRQTKTSNIEEYLTEWMAFQERFVEMMPLIPLYSNNYFDFYATELQNYNIGQSKSWAIEMPVAWIGERDVE